VYERTAADGIQLFGGIGFTWEHDQHLFGTAGLRGEVGAGPNRMNRAVVIRTTRGLADHLLADRARRGRADAGVVVGFDARTTRSGSRPTRRGARRRGHRGALVPDAAADPADRLRAEGARRGRRRGRHRLATTRPADNGYKVYAEGAAQIVPADRRAIAAAIEAVGPAAEVPRVDPLASDLVAPVDAEVRRPLPRRARRRPAPVDGPAT
jgi:phosphomannomutase